MQWNGLLKKQFSRHNWCNSVACLLCRAHRAMGWISRWGMWKEDAELTVTWLSSDTEKPRDTHRNLDSLLRGLWIYSQQSWQVTKTVSKSAEKKCQWLWLKRKNNRKLLLYSICLKKLKRERSFVSFFNIPFGKTVFCRSTTYCLFTRFCFYWAFCFKQELSAFYPLIWCCSNSVVTLSDSY